MNPKKVVIPVKLVLKVLNRGTGIERNSNYPKKTGFLLEFIPYLIRDRNDRK